MSIRNLSSFYTPFSLIPLSILIFYGNNVPARRTVAYLRKRTQANKLPAHIGILVAAVPSGPNWTLPPHYTNLNFFLPAYIHSYAGQRYSEINFPQKIIS
jgi:hypothetical protein